MERRAQPEAAPRWPRLVALVLPCSAVIAAVLAGMALERDALVGAFARTDWVDAKLVPALRAWRARPATPGVLRGVVFGDSVLGVEPGSSVLARQVEADLGARGLSADLFAAVHGAFRAFQFYYLVDEVLATRPRLAVVEVNLRAFSRDWDARTRWRFPSASRYLSPGRVLALREVLAREDLSLLAPTLYRLQEATGTLHLGPGLRAYGEEALERSGDWVGSRLGLDGVPPTERMQRLFVTSLDAGLARAWYGGEPADTLVARVLRELRRALREGGAVTVLLVTPVNVDRIAELGLADELALPRKLAALRAAVGAAPDEWVDLHAAARPPEFLDATEHVHPETLARLAAPVAASVATQLTAPPQ